MVSIIVPVYNCKDSLERCIRAIQAQTWGAWELILVDDGATDGSGAICDRAAAEDRRLRVIHQANGGVSSARNAGIEAAAGEYILFCDSDDYPAPRWCEALLAAGERYPRTFPVCNYFREQGGTQSVNYEEKCEQLTEKVGSDDFFGLYQLELLGTPWNKLYYREILTEHQIRFARDLSLGEDLLFNLEYMQYLPEGFAVVKEPLYHYVLGNQESLSARYYPNLQEMYETVFAGLEEALRREPGAFEKYAGGFWTSCFFAFDRVFRNNCSPRNQEGKPWAANAAVFHSALFQRCRKGLPGHTIHPLQQLALGTNSFRLYWLTVLFTEKVSHWLH